MILFLGDAWIHKSIFELKKYIALSTKDTKVAQFDLLS